MQQIGLRCIRWGTAFLLAGVWTGYGPFHHYLHGGHEPSCPAAPIHAHVVLLGWVGLTIFGLVYRALPGEADSRTLKLARIHFWLSAISVLGTLLVTMTLYGVLDWISPGFYYAPDMPRLQIWLLTDGAFLSLFALGSVLFAIVVFRMTRRGAPAAASE